MRHSTLLHSTVASLSLPRAIQGQVFAAATNTEIEGLFATFSESIDEFKKFHGSRYNDIEAALENITVQLAAAKLGGGTYAGRREDPEYSQIFARYFRNGAGENEMRAAQGVGSRAQIQAAMSVGTNSDGGFLAPTEWDRKISAAQRARSPMRKLATVQVTSVGAFTRLWNDEAWGSGWVGESASRPATTTPTLSQINFGHGEIYANAAITQRLLDDSEIDLEKWIADQVETEFNRQEGVAFLSGNGVNKPFGFLQYVTGGAAETQHPGGVIGVTPTGSASTVTFDSLIQVKYDLAAPYRQNSTWLMNSQTAAVVQKIKDAGNNYIWQPEIQAGMPPTLLGRPVEFDEGMPNIAANSLSIAYGDFASGYLINDRIGVRVLRDPYTNKPFVNFYVTKRVGGGVQDPKAIRLLKVAAS